MSKYPYKPEGMSDEAYERLHRFIAEKELKYADKLSTRGKSA